MKMVEKVARALCAKVDGNNPDKVHKTRNGVEMSSWEFYREDAIIAIEAMRAPTNAMLSDEICDELERDMDHMTAMGSLNVAYQAMIQAALKEGQ